MTSHELAKILLNMPDVNIDIRNIAGDFGGEVEKVELIPAGKFGWNKDYSFIRIDSESDEYLY